MCVIVDMARVRFIEVSVKKLFQYLKKGLTINERKS